LKTDFAVALLYLKNAARIQGWLVVKPAAAGDAVLTLVTQPTPLQRPIVELLGLTPDAYERWPPAENGPRNHSVDLRNVGLTFPHKRVNCGSQQADFARSALARLSRIDG